MKTLLAAAAALLIAAPAMAQSSGSSSGQRGSQSDWPPGSSGTGTSAGIGASGLGDAGVSPSQGGYGGSAHGDITPKNADRSRQAKNGRDSGNVATGRNSPGDPSTHQAGNGQ